MYLEGHKCVLILLLPAENVHIKFSMPQKTGEFVFKNITNKMLIILVLKFGHINTYTCCCLNYAISCVFNMNIFINSTHAL